MNISNRKTILKFLGLYWVVNSIVFLINTLGYSIGDSFIAFANMNVFNKIFIIIHFIASYIAFFSLFAAIPSLIGLLITLLIPRKWLVIPIVLITGVFIQILLNIDIVCFNLYRFHFQGVMLSMLFTPEANQIFDLGTKEIMLFVLVCTAIFIFQSILVFWVSKKSKVIEKQKLFWRFLILHVFCWYCALLIISLVIAKTENFRLYKTAVRTIPFYDYFVIHLIKVKILINFNEFQMAILCKLGKLMVS